MPKAPPVQQQKTRCARMSTSHIPPRRSSPHPSTSSTSSIVTTQQQRAAVAAAEKRSTTSQQAAPAAPWNYNVIAKKPHPKDKLPIQWVDGRIKVTSTQWDYINIVELAYDTPFQTLKEIVIATGGWIIQRATLETRQTSKGQLLLTHEMELPGVRDAPIPTSQKKINLKQHGIEDLRPIRAPLTFVVGR